MCRKRFADAFVENHNKCGGKGYEKGDVVFVESHNLETCYYINGNQTYYFEGVLVGKIDYSDVPYWLVEPSPNNDKYLPMVTVPESDISEPEYPF